MRSANGSIQETELVKQGKFKQRTLESYEERLRLHVLPYIGGVKLADLKPTHIRKMQDNIKSDPMKREARRVISAVLKDALYDELITSNPVNSVRPPDPSDYEPEVLDLQDIEVYLWHFKDTRIENVVLLALGGAYRRGEICALDVEDINLETGEVTIDDAYVASIKDQALHETTKTGEKRNNFLPRFVLERLRVTLPESGPIARRHDGERLTPAAVSRLYRKIQKTLPEGVPRISLKNLRHTSLTMVFDATGNFDAVKEHGGHASQNTSRRFYVRAHEHQKKQAAKAVDALFSGK